jgi:hypothetical protein
MIINNFHNVVSIITIQVFQQHYYDEVTQVKCLLSSKRWRFESIINQLIIYSLHKPHSPAKVRYWSPSQLLRHSVLRTIHSARIISQLHGRKVRYSAS